MKAKTIPAAATMMETEPRRLLPGRTRSASPAPTCPVTSGLHCQAVKLERRFIANEIQPLLDGIDDEQKDRYGDED
ncbi:unnamed protein product [marine sediment metagenome]|uniref:Uncharacterized protein n=1 Tax=marine sediment metagenome TaxID=412755 RepID=X1JL68_9ZZZZ